MRDAKAASQRAAALKALLDEVKKAYDAARAEADHALIELRARYGATTVQVTMPGCDLAVAQISLSEPKPGVLVDEAGFLAYCQREHPTEVVETVRPGSRRAILARLAIEDGRVVDPATGRVPDFATVAEPGPPSTTLTWKTGGRDEVARAYRDGRLALTELLALPAPSTE